MTEAMPFLQKTILLSYDPRPLLPGDFHCTGDEAPVRSKLPGGAAGPFRIHRSVRAVQRASTPGPPKR